jgi:competence ComEA-like helix-hairpin-helix protein
VPSNLTTATSEELQLAPGIGPVRAEKILQMRKCYGAFKSVDDLSAIRGIGSKRVEKMRKDLTIGKPAPSRPAAPDGKCLDCIVRAVYTLEVFSTIPHIFKKRLPGLPRIWGPGKQTRRRKSCQIHLH